ncbi:MAG TPA: hypothetical protein VGS57_21415 [Thermoanaerobaculia bacterium]|nr:hypothetical protein [Thermoanaerobaculia bacterium]
MRVRVAVALIAFLIAGAALAQQWPQWGHDPQHSSMVTFNGQSLNENLVNIVYDPLVPQEMAESEPIYGEAVLLAHYQAPLVDGNDVYMMFKDGQFNVHNYSTQRWGETKYTWNNSHTSLGIVWQFASDWDAPGNLYNNWEPVFHPALANGYIYIPGAAGAIVKVNKTTGAEVSRISPFVNMDSSAKAKIFVISPITVDAGGNLYYNVIYLNDATNYFNNDAINSWLVKVAPSDQFSTVQYSAITAGAPAATALCVNAFSTRADFTIVDGPWPPSPTAVPNSVVCGSQRPGFNAAPAVAPDGTIYVISRAHLISREGFLVAVNPNLTQKWIASLRNRFRDGCGVPVALGGTLPPNGAPGGCRAGANYGVDPATNAYGGGRVLDDSSSSPVIGPDGSIYYGSYTRYNYAQGHMMRFSPAGAFLGAYNFGWDITPGIYKHGTTYSVDTKDNHYGEVGSYCDDPAFCPDDESGRAYPEGYFVTQLSPTLRADALSDRGDQLMTVEWTYQNTNTQSCERAGNGSVSCTETHPNGFEWCINAFVIDKNGTLYANSEDGWLFRIEQGGVVTTAPGCGVTTFECGGKIFQQLALGAAYTPTSIDKAGRIYSQNAGHLFVAGN